MRDGIQLHLVGHFAADAATTVALVGLGFGAVVAERLRGVGELVAGAGDGGADVEHVDPGAAWDAYAPLAAEHAAYYRQSPPLPRQGRRARHGAGGAAPSVRRRGIGRALLRRTVVWARHAGFERVLVEHETANLEGGGFWRRHFTPYLVSSMRYVERTLGP